MAYFENWYIDQLEKILSVSKALFWFPKAYMDYQFHCSIRPGQLEKLPTGCPIVNLVAVQILHGFILLFLPSNLCGVKSCSQIQSCCIRQLV